MGSHHSGYNRRGAGARASAGARRRRRRGPSPQQVEVDPCEYRAYRRGPYPSDRAIHLRRHGPGEATPTEPRASSGRHHGMGHGRRASQGRDAPFRRRLPDASHSLRRRPSPARVLRPRGRRGAGGLALGGEPHGTALAARSSRDRGHPPPDQGVRAALHRGQGRPRRDARAARPAPGRRGLHPGRARRGDRERRGGPRLPAHLSRPAGRPRHRGRLLACDPCDRQGGVGSPASSQPQPQGHLAPLPDRPAGSSRQRGGGEGPPAPDLPPGHRGEGRTHDRPGAVPFP
ncbi:MAG: hypothetical protein BWY94_02521 [Actinobacteria bacterium ADurb.BinA094]|nr:MAG: hypothetical protein BWY94_02521 [Actinobacteria bacterium ADurb.BinA094]